MIPLPHRGASRVASVVVAIVMTWCACAPAFGATVSGAPYMGSASNLGLNQPIVGMAATPSGKGYWLVAADGGIFSFGDAHFYGSLGAFKLPAPVVSMQRTASGKGYWMMTQNGHIYRFGDAKGYGDTGSCTNYFGAARMLVTPDGKGYWIATDT